MRKGLTLICAVAVVAVTLAGAGRALAQEEGEAAPVNQAELASMMTKVLGLQRFVPPVAAATDYFLVLSQNNVFPIDGWKADEVVTVNTLAVVAVKALKLTSEVEDPSDPASYVSVLGTHGIPLDTVGATLAHLKPLEVPVAPTVIAGNVDPSYKRYMFNPADEVTFGADYGARAQIVTESTIVSVVLPEVTVAPSGRPRRTTSPI